jgi:hypothetical protein
MKSYKLKGSHNKELVAGTEYVLGKLSEDCRPKNNVQKEIVIRNGVYALLNIVSNGEVRLVPRQNVSVDNAITIYEIFI